MKNKALKTLSLALVAGMVSCASVGAMAANVSTTTSYDWAQTGKNANVTVITNVTDATPNAQVTYYVAKKVGEDDKIIYIDQKPATDGSVVFKFSANQDELYGEVSTCALLKMGSDAGIDFGNGFKFVNGSNLITSGTPTATPTTVTFDGGVVGLAGTVSGNITQYGVKNADGSRKFRAYGCTDTGVYAVTFDNRDTYSTDIADFETYAE